MASPNPSEPDQARLQQLSSSYNATNATNSNNTSRPDSAAAAVPARDYTYPPPPTLSNRFQDIDDPAALLESLASFDQVVEQANVTNHQFERLLQAAATADDAETSRAGQNQRRIAHSSTPERADFSKIGRAASTKRKRSAEPEKEFGLIGTGPNNAKKRKKVDDEEEDLEEDYDEDYAGDGFDDLARERDIWGPDDDDTPSKFEYYTTASAVAEDARTAGVHSAAALFRRPSAASKKYTRPPMSKLFTSLELTPEQFLHLQAAAKAYMLNEAHPERRDCVGGRHRGDTDMTKLRLFACVKSFLEDEGWGERCFGKSAPGAEARKLKYPQMKNKIISLITPLLRRMVTNERQRLYAVETRKQNAGKVRQKRGSKTKSQQGSPQVQPNHVASSPQYSPESRLSAPPVSDPNLNQNHESSNSPHQNGEVVAQPIGSYSEAVEKDPVRYHINLLNGGRRARPKSVLRPKECQGFASLVQLLQTFAREEGLPNPNSIQVMSANGLIDVKDEASWTAAIDGVKQNDWMDGDVRVIAQAII